MYIQKKKGMLPRLLFVFHGVNLIFKITEKGNFKLKPLEIMMMMMMVMTTMMMMTGIQIFNFLNRNIFLKDNVD